MRNQINSHPPAPELRNCSRLGPVRTKSSSSLNALREWSPQLASNFPCLLAVLFENVNLVSLCTWRSCGTPLLAPDLRLEALPVWTGGSTPSDQGRPVEYYSCESLLVRGGGIKQPRMLSKVP